MIIYGRDARIGPRSLKHLFSGSYRNPEANRLSGIYELSLRRANEAGSPGRSLIAWFCSRFWLNKHTKLTRFIIYYSFLEREQIL